MGQMKAIIAHVMLCLQTYVRWIMLASLLCFASTEMAHYSQHYCWNQEPISRSGQSVRDRPNNKQLVQEFLKGCGTCAATHNYAKLALRHPGAVLCF